MRSINFFWLVAAILFAAFSALPATAQQSDQGVWIRDNQSKCEVWAPSWATRSSINGSCVNGRVEGLASISLYLENTITDLYDGYFLGGYYIAPQKIDGQVSDAPIGKLFEILMGIDRLKVYSKLTPRTKRSSACGDTLYAAINIQQIPLNAENSRKIGDAILQRYMPLCASFGQDGSYPTISVQFVPFTFFNSTTPPVYARANASWQATTWQVTDVETTDLLGPPQRQSFTGAAPAPAPNPAPAGPQTAAPAPAAAPATSGRVQPIDLTLSAFISSSTSLGYPTCQANLRIANRGRSELSGIAISGNVYTAQRQLISNFRAARDNALPVNAQITIRSNLPAAACSYVGIIQVAQISCKIGAQTIADCKPFVRFISNDVSVASTSPAAGVTILPNVQVAY
ncbi:MAG: hypothetical protein ACK5XX_05350 [Holosporales bacterium]